VDQGLALDAYIEQLEGRLGRCWRDALLGPEHQPGNELFATILLLEEAKKKRVLASQAPADLAA
jgi:hypothetical protein